MLLTPDYVPKDYAPVQVVQSMEELHAASFIDGTKSAILYPRSLRDDFNHDFDGLAAALDNFLGLQDTKIQMLYPDELQAQCRTLKGSAKTAANAIVRDMQEIKRALAGATKKDPPLLLLLASIS